MKVATADPGFNTGIAFWKDWGEVIPSRTTVLRAPEEGSDVERMKALFEAYSVTMLAMNPDLVYIENSGYWDSSARSRRSLGSGALTKLTLIVGGLVALSLPNVRLINPIDWKGTLKKDILIARIRIATDGLEYRDHEREAVGLGLSVRKWL